MTDDTSPTRGELPRRPASEPGDEGHPTTTSADAGRTGRPIELVKLAKRSGPGHHRYRVRRLLGEGGMGEVFLGEDDRIGRTVAIKSVFEADAQRPELTARFLREARVQGQLEHPAIVPVYDLDWDESGRAFFTMRRIRGDTLAHVLRELRRGNEHYVRAYSLRRLLGVFQQVCLAVDFAHERGVVHRDLKPQNLILGDFGEVYVLDWGIAKLTGTEDPDSVREHVAGVDAEDTRRDQVFGTAGYMAPEQLESAAAAEVRSDVYSLGAVLFHILALEPLHGKGDHEERVRSTREGADARPSARAPERDVPPELDAICVRATAMDPADRFPSARALHDAVERYLEGERDLELRARLARQEQRDARKAAQRALGPLGGFCLLGMAFLGTQLVWTGLRSWFDVGLIIVPVLMAAAHAFYIGAAQPERFDLHAVLLSAPICVAIGASASIAGALMLTPMLALAMCVAACTLRGLGRYRLVILAMAILALVVPFLGERAGLFPRSYLFDAGAMTILPNAVELAEDRVPWLLFVNSLSTIVVVCVFVWRAVDQRVVEAPKA